jgi:acyl-coenzyme A synthetase/AMP-(fatty) acid ligase
VVRDGAIHYLGRLDEQVKVRGHRIEIQEVHDLALTVAGVHQVAVSVVQAGLGGLELFVVPVDDATVAAAELVSAVLEHLRANLPAAAVPGKVWVVSQLVANAHGKFDPTATRKLAGGARDAEDPS